MTEASPKTAGAEALLKAREVAAKDLGLPVDDWRTKRYAFLMAALDREQARFGAGADVNLDDLLKIDTQMQEIRNSLPLPPPKVELTIVEGVQGVYRCRHCGKENHLKPGEYTPLKSKSDKPSPVIEGTVTEVTPSAKPDTDKAENKPTVAPKAEKPQQSPKWQGEGDRAFMPAVNFVEAVEGWTRPSVWPSRGGLRANQPLPPPSQACQNKKHR